MRKQGWDVELPKFIASRQHAPFQWGVQDCTLFAVDCAQVITGQDLGAKYRGTYHDEAGAAEIIKEAGGSLRQLVNANLPGKEFSPKFARRGDWVMVDQDGSQALAVCLGSVVAAAGRKGLVFRPMADAITAWRID